MKPPAHTFNTPAHYSNQCIIDIETTSFQPWEGIIICIGIKNIDDSEIRVFEDVHEEAMILQFLQYFNNKQFRKIIGYNIGFDMRFLFTRCLRYRIKANGFFDIPTVDLMHILKNVRERYSLNQCGKLDDWAKSLLGKQKLFDNTQVALLYENGRISDIVEYCIQDLELEDELRRRIEIVLER